MLVFRGQRAREGRKISLGAISGQAVLLPGRHDSLARGPRFTRDARFQAARDKQVTDSRGLGLAADEIRTGVRLG